MNYSIHQGMQKDKGKKRPVLSGNGIAGTAETGGATAATDTGKGK